MLFVASLALLLGISTSPIPPPAPGQCSEILPVDVASVFRRHGRKPEGYLDGKVHEYKVPLATNTQQERFLIYLSGVGPENGMLVYAVQGPCNHRVCLTLVAERLDGVVGQPEFIYRFSVPRNFLGQVLVRFGPLKSFQRHLEDQAKEYFRGDPAASNLSLDIVLEELDKPRNGVLIRKEDAALTLDYVRAFDDAVCSFVNGK